MRDKIALAIITKNRPIELVRCLNSIQGQSFLPDEVIIIDNDQNQSAKKIIHDEKYHSLVISYIPSLGSVPYCRNLALNKAKTTFLGFVDDDCVLKKSWLKNTLQTIRKHEADYVLGKTLLLNSQNIFALAQYAHDEYWKNYSEQIFDTKNVLLNLHVIKKNQLKFDENCQKDQFDSADFDFNFQVKKLKLKGVFAEDMKLLHQETTSFSHFSKRAYARGYLAKYLNDKWQLQNQLVDFGQKNPMIWLLKLVKNFHKDYQKYSIYMNSTSTIKKMAATILIRVFEYYYTKGYEENKEEFKIKN